MLPKTTGLVQGTAGQFDRLVTLVGGAVQTPGFDSLMRRFTAFSEQTLTTSISKLTTFLATAEAGDVGGPIQDFMATMQDVGPQVWDTLMNVGEALANVLTAGADVGVGLLDVVNVLSDIVAAVPPEAIALMLQLAVAIKAVQLAAAGGAAARAGMLALTTQVVAMRTAASGAPGALAGVGAAITGLSRAAKLAMAGTGIGLFLIGLTELSQLGQETPPNVDRLTTSLGKLGQSGKVSGEAARLYGKDLDKLYESVRNITDPSTVDNVQNALVKVFSLGKRLARTLTRSMTA
jgi:hypothetical protein